MGRGISVTEREYLYIKELISKGLTTEEIAKKTGRSLDTIRTVNYSYDYGDFQKTPTKELRKRRKKQKEEQLQINVEDICELEKNDIPSTPICEVPPVESKSIVELSSKDKKELAMYAIDQHYFFLKQLTGVI